MQSTKNLTFNLILLIVTIIVFFLLAEAAFRIFLPQNLEFVKFDPLLEFRQIPNFEGQLNSPFTDEFKTEIKINSKGLRDREFSFEKENFRILVLGDSMTFGEGVSLEDTYPKILEKRFGENFEVINTGTRGYDADNYYLFLKYEGLKYDPDLVILGFFVDNDINSNDLIIFNGSKSFERRLQNPSAVINLRRGLARNSHLYSFFVTVLRGNEAANDFLIKTGIFVSNPVPFYLQDAEIFEENLKKTKRVVKLIDSLSKENNIEFLLLLIPHKDQLKDTESDLLFRPQQELIKFGEQEDILTIDVLPLLDDLEKTYFFEQNKHLNQEGHQIISDSLFETLINSDLI